MIIIEYLGKPVSVNQRYYKNFSLTQKYRDFKETFKLISKVAMCGRKPLVNEIWAEISIHYKGRTPDIDNYVKPVLDSMSSIVYNDDIQITRLTITKHKSGKDKVVVYIDDYSEEI